MSMLDESRSVYSLHVVHDDEEDFALDEVVDCPDFADELTAVRTAFRLASELAGGHDPYLGPSKVARRTLKTIRGQCLAPIECEVIVTKAIPGGSLRHYEVVKRYPVAEFVGTVPVIATAI